MWRFVFSGGNQLQYNFKSLLTQWWFPGKLTAHDYILIVNIDLQITEQMHLRFDPKDTDANHNIYQNVNPWTFSKQIVKNHYINAYQFFIVGIEKKV